MGVDKTREKEHSGTCWNNLENLGTSRNIPGHEKIKIISMKKKNINNEMIFVKINTNVTTKKKKRKIKKKKLVSSQSMRRLFCRKLFVGRVRVHANDSN